MSTPVAQPRLAETYAGEASEWQSMQSCWSGIAASAPADAACGTRTPTSHSATRPQGTQRSQRRRPPPDARSRTPKMSSASADSAISPRYRPRIATLPSTVTPSVLISCTMSSHCAAPWRTPNAASERSAVASGEAAARRSSTTITRPIANDARP